MNLSFSPTPEYSFVVLPSETGKLFATEFKIRCIAANSLDDNIVNNHKVLAEFQAMCVNVYVEEFLECDGDYSHMKEVLDLDILGVFYVYLEFLEKYPKANVVSIVPIDLKGNFGFVVANDM